MALFITSDLAWTLSWRRHRKDRGEAGEGGKKQIQSQEHRVRDSGFQIKIYFYSGET